MVTRSVFSTLTTYQPSVGSFGLNLVSRLRFRGCQLGPGVDLADLINGSLVKWCRPLVVTKLENKRLDLAVWYLPELSHLCLNSEIPDVPIPNVSTWRSCSLYASHGAKSPFSHYQLLSLQTPSISILGLQTLLFSVLGLQTLSSPRRHYTNSSRIWWAAGQLLLLLLRLVRSYSTPHNMIFLDVW